MPIKTGKDEKGHFIRYGHLKKYYYDPLKPNSFQHAKNRAHQQMMAVIISKNQR